MSLLLYEDTKFDPKKPEPYNKRIGIDAKEYARFLNHYYEFKEEEHPITPETSFTVLVEAIHADMPTRNYTRYKKSSFRGAIPTWSTVYRHMPVIMYHNDYNGQIIGRVIEAYEDKAVRSEAEGLKADALMLRIAVPDWRMENQIRNGILDSVSIGASATDVRCSICGEQLQDGNWCEHSRGCTYKNKDTGKEEICYWDVYEWEARELSFVITPQDPYAGVLSYSMNYGQNEDTTPDDSKYTMVSGRSRPRIMSSSANENEDSKVKKPVKVQESEDPTLSHNKDKNKEKAEGENELDIKEAEQKISSLETEVKAVSMDKDLLSKKIDGLNKEKIALQESINELTKQKEEKELAASQEKQLREAAEGRIESLEKEAKTCLAESLAILRKKAGKPALEKLEERSIDSLRDSIADLKAELKEAAEKEKKEEQQNVPGKGSVKSQTLNEGEEKPESSQGKEEKTEPGQEDFDDFSL